MRAFLLLAAIGALIVGTVLYSEHQQRQRLEALARAVVDRRVDEVRALLAAGVDPNATLDGPSPIERAAGAGRLEVVALLLAHGAVVPERSRPEERAANLAQAGGHDAVRRLLLLADSDSGPVFHVAVLGHLELAVALRDAGFALDEPRARDGMRPLSGASMAGSVPMTRFLLDHGASAAGPKTHFGQTPLHHAALGGSAEIVELLLASGADPSAVDTLGWTPLHLAALSGHGDAVEALASPAAAVHALDTADVLGWTPLMRAVSSGDTHAVGALLGRGADVRAASASGRTALHVAAERDLDSLYDRLLAAGGDEEARDALGTTPRELQMHEHPALGDPNAGAIGDPIVRSGWFNVVVFDGGVDEFRLWEDGVVCSSDPGSPWWTPESFRLGRIPPARVRRLAVELEESALFRHPAYEGRVTEHGSTCSVMYRAAAPGQEQERWFQVPSGPHFTDIDWRHEPETNATLVRVWRDVQDVLTSARPALTEPLTDHLVDSADGAAREFRGLRWANE